MLTYTYLTVKGTYEGVEEGAAATVERGRGGEGGALSPLCHPRQLSSPALPAGASVCSSGAGEGTARCLLFYTLTCPSFGAP
jgi:hypothetical protein